MARLQTLGAVELRADDNTLLASVMRQPKRLGLLAYLAAGHATVHSRDSLLALFWPESATAPARRALSKSLHFLRERCGKDMILSHGHAQIEVNRTLLQCDAFDFRRAVERDDGRLALQLYNGTLLPGLFVSGCPAFEEWLDDERRWFRGRAKTFALAASEEEISKGRPLEARLYTDIASRIDPHDEDVVRQIIRVHLLAGDRMMAVRRFQEFRAWLRQELGTEPSAETMRLLEEPETIGAHMSAIVVQPGPELLAASRDAVGVRVGDDYAELVESLSDMVFRCDLQGSFPYVNEAAIRTMGWSREEFRDIQYQDLVREDFRDRVIEFYLRQLEDRTPVTYLEFPAVARDGHELWVGQKVQLVERDGAVMGIQAVTRDITARLRREAANRRSAFVDRETGLYSRDAFHLLAEQRIALNGRTNGPFFATRVRVVPGEDGDLDDVLPAGTISHLVRLVRSLVRASDVATMVGELEMVVMAPRGGDAEATVVRDRLDGAIAHWPPVVEADATVYTESSVYLPDQLRSTDPLLAASTNLS